MSDTVVRRLASVSSTQDAAAGLPIGSIVVADHQTAGRGRLDRRWEAPPGGALLATFVVEPSPLASLAAGVAAAEVCGPDVRLKWPNDLLLDGRKLAGILVEVRGGRALVGIGLNLTWAPEGGAKLGSRDPLRLAEELAEALRRWLRAPAPELLARWRELADTLGREVRVEIGRETFSGRAEDIAEDGSLVVAGRRVSAGEVTHLRTSPPAPPAG